MTTMPDIAEPPVLIKTNGGEAADFIAWFQDHRREIEDLLKIWGAIKFQNVRIGSPEDFRHIIDAISDKSLSYIDGNSPRIKLAGNVYTSTEFDRSQKITMHNELSYSAKWPNLLYFSCLQPSLTGGETLLADSRQIVRTMDPLIVGEIEAKGLWYIRNLHGGHGLGPSWQATFETEDARELEAYCRDYSINYEWKEDNSLRLRQFSKGIIHHRLTGERVWFSQIDQFHPSHLDGELFEVIQSLYDNPEDYPMNVQFGDGKEISADIVKEIMDTIDSVTVAPAWDRNELLLIDNELVSHGRNPYTGERKVLVSMSK